MGDQLVKEGFCMDDDLIYRKALICTRQIYRSYYYSLPRNQINNLRLLTEPLYSIFMACYRIIEKQRDIPLSEIDLSPVMRMMENDPADGDDEGRNA